MAKGLAVYVSCSPLPARWLLSNCHSTTARRRAAEPHASMGAMACNSAAEGERTHAMAYPAAGEASGTTLASTAPPEPLSWAPLRLK
eukprot:scaffold96075_cov31-Tisochrysis_lutea.AAC.10